MALLLPPSTTCHAETWTALNDQSIEAKMLGMWDDRVILEMDGARRFAVPLSSLRSESRIQARAMWEKMQTQRQTRVEELAGQAEAAAAPAPNPLPKPPAAAAYEKPPANAKVDAFMEHIDDQLAAGHFVVLYDALPPSYRKDVDEIVKLAAAKIDPTGWNAMTGFMHKVGNLVLTRQNWLFSHPRFEAMDPEDMEQVKELALAAAWILRDGFDPQAMDLQELQTMEFGQWLTERDSAISGYIAAANQFAPMDSRVFSVVKQDDKTAEVKASQGTTTETLKLVNVDGYWVTEEMSKSWSDQVAENKLQLQQDENNPTAALAGFALASGFLVPFESAQDETTFHAQIETVLASVLPNLEQQVAALGVSIGGSRNRNMGYGSGYDSSYEDQMMEEGMDYEEQMKQQERMMREMSQP